MQTYASASFTDSDGHSAIVVVQRNLLNGFVITEVLYSFCIDSGLTVCQEGSSGPFDQSSVPNGDFIGQVTGNYLKPDTLTLQIDTGTVQGFSNYLCYLPNPYTGGCDGGTAPATGGLISLTWTKTPISANLNNNTVTNIANRTIDTQSYTTDFFSAKVIGTVLGQDASRNERGNMAFVSQSVTNKTLPATSTSALSQWISKAPKGQRALKRIARLWSMKL